MATGSASETFATLGGGGGGPRRAKLRNQMMWNGCTLQPLANGPKINYNEMVIKRQAYNEYVSALPYSRYNVTTNTKCKRSIIIPVFLLSHCPESKYGGDH